MKYDANVNAVDDIGETPLHEASEYGHFGAARVLEPATLCVTLFYLQILVEAGASKEAFDDDGNTPRDKICSRARRCPESTKESLENLLSL